MKKIIPSMKKGAYILFSVFLFAILMTFVDAVIQPGGSVRDQETIDYCNANNIAMVMTGIRHFKH